MNNLARILILLALVGLVAGPVLADDLAPEEQAFVDAMIDHLSERPPGADVPAVCFAPDTPADYVALVNDRMRHAYDLPFGADDSGRYRLGSRWATTATNGGGLGQGDPTTLTWSYAADGVTIPGFNGEPTSPNQLHAWLNGLYGDFNTWHNLFIQIFDRWSALTGFNYVYEPNDDGAAFGSTAGALGVRGDLRIGAHFIDGNSGILAYNFFPNNGDMVIDAFDTFYNNTTNNSLRMRNVLAHEHGHGLGLRHVCPVQQTKLMEPFVSVAFDGPQFDDVLGAQRGYGDFNEHNDTDATATSIGNGNITLSDVSIDDGGGNDWYALTVAGPSLFSVSVAPSGVTYLEGPQNANGSCSAGTNFDPRTELDLILEVIDTDGVVVLATADDGPAGTVESINGVALAGAGTYFVRVSSNDTFNLIQGYELTASTGAAIFVDGFESGNTSAWSLTVP